MTYSSSRCEGDFLPQSQGGRNDASSKHSFNVFFQLSHHFLQKYPGKLHVAADGWTSPNVIAFIGATVHWIVDGKVASIILDFIK